jgi:biotin carboxylase
LASAVQGLLGAPSVDVQGAEDVVEPLREQLPWSSNPVAARVPDPDHVTMLFDKLAMTRFAESVPVAVPRTWETPPLDVLPLVVKGRLGAGGQAVRIARSHEEVADAVVELEAAGHGRLFFRELAEGTLTNVGGVADRGRLLVAGAYRAVAPEHDRARPA